MFGMFSGKYHPRIGPQAFPDMAAQAKRGGTIVSICCAHCGDENTIGFANLKSVYYVDPPVGENYGMWRCDAECVKCEKVTRHVHFPELLNAEGDYLTAPDRNTILEWKELGYVPDPDYDATPKWFDNPWVYVSADECDLF